MVVWEGMNIPSLRTLLEKEMNRREFLAYLGAVFITLIGVQKLLNTLSDPHSNQKAQSAPKKSGYGYSSGSYGGKV